jgi:iron complex outermembrane recepter protein
MIKKVKPRASRVNETTKGEGKMRISIKLFASTIIASGIASGLLISSPVFAQSAPADGAVDEKDIIVTGVFNAKKIEDAPISINVVTAAEIAQQVPVSAADLLKNVPGVFVNSSLGEIRNVIFSRGVSANSLDGAGGYYYVSLQEDGLPVEAVTTTNFGPDYFARPDIMLNRLEALRGGTSTVTGSNAPGGIFNYISRTGKSSPGVEVQGKFGLEGDGRSPYYRADAYVGGQLGSGDLYYAIGGFYRKSDGARTPGYAMNRGGQIRANLLWDYGSGTVRFDAKYLDDRNAWFEFTPTNNYANPKFATGFNNFSSVLPPRGPNNYTNPDGTTGTYDASNLVHSQSLSFGLTWENDASAIVHVQNRARYSENKTNWNTGALIFALPLDDAFAAILPGVFGIPGVTTYKFANTGAVAAVVQSFSGFDRTVTTNNLPNQAALANGTLNQIALAQTFKTKEFQDQMSFGAKLGNHQLAAGAYVSLNTFAQQGGSAGIGLSTFTSQPTMLTASIVDSRDGKTYQITNASGFGAQGTGVFDGVGYFGTQKQLSFFAGDTWDISEQLSVDVGLRYESLGYDITNKNTNVGTQPYGTNNGGADGNPLTLYDNSRNTFGPNTRVKRNYSYFNYTGAINYKLNDNFQAYARYTKGQKAPDFGVIASLNQPDEIAAIFPQAQTIEQFEIGLKYRSRGVRIGLYPFYSKLSNVADQQIFSEIQPGGSTTLVTPPPLFGTIKTYGVEFNGDIDIGSMFNLRTAITIQEPKASGFGTIAQSVVTNTVTGRNTYTYTGTTTPEGDADNNPKFMTRTTATFKPSDAFQIFLTHSYLGRRAANRANAFYLPGFHTFDLGASYEFAKRLKLQVNVNNLFNQFGVMSWARGGGFFNSLDRQGLTKAEATANPNALYSVVPAQPRSFWITATAKF